MVPCLLRPGRNVDQKPAPEESKTVRYGNQKRSCATLKFSASAAAVVRKPPNHVKVHPNDLGGFPGESTRRARRRRVLAKEGSIVCDLSGRGSNIKVRPETDSMAYRGFPGSEPGSIRGNRCRRLEVENSGRGRGEVFIEYVLAVRKTGVFLNVVDECC